MSKPSIVQPEKACYVTGATYGLDLHHCIHGSHRRKADQLGLTVWLRHDVHMALHDHRKPFENLDWELKQAAQRAYERDHSREEWMAIFGRSWLDE